MSSIHDVAKLANVSTATVSRALNSGLEMVKEETLDRVLAACREVGYTPNAAGRSLRRMTSDVFGVLSYPSCRRLFSDLFYLHIFEGVEVAMIEHNKNLLISGFNANKEQRQRPKFMADGSVAGMLLLGIYPENELLWLAEGSLVPTVLVDTYSPTLGCDAVLSDGAKAFAEIAWRFKECGHERIMIVSHAYPDYNKGVRMGAFLEAASACGYPNSQVFTYTQIKTDLDPMMEYQPAVDLIKKNGVTAVAANHDRMALELKRVLEANDLRVPEDVSLIGYDSVEGSTTEGWLSTYYFDQQLLGRMGAELILERTENPDLPCQKRMIQSEFIDRGSLRKLN
ncbi:MAG: hypothetical protein DRP64_16030 [Verrucomicrobia bacterium]|nr:MAG: hypothetical protein DRP64_16030 [Verrucomicrobiota bacterium]